MIRDVFHVPCPQGVVDENRDGTTRKRAEEGRCALRPPRQQNCNAIACANVGRVERLGKR